MRDNNQGRELQVAYQDGRLTRRQFVEGALKLGFSATAAAGLLSACNSKAKKAAPARLSGRVQILIGFAGGNSPRQLQVQQTLAQAFIAAHPQVGIDVIRATSASAAQSELTALVERGAAPDIVLGVGLADISRYADQHMWLDLRPFFKQDAVSTDAFVSEARSAAALSSYYGSTKAIPGVPLGIHDQALAYNVELFSTAGLSPPPTKWSDQSWSYSGAFLGAAQALTIDRNGHHAGQPGFDAGAATQYGVARIPAEAIFYSFGGHLYNSSKRQAQFNSADSLQGAQFAGDLVNRYQVQPTAAGLAQLNGPRSTGDAELAAWRAGKLAMIDMCSCDLGSSYATDVPFEWKVAALPSGPNHAVGLLEVTLGAIVASSSQHQLAWEVLKFLACDPVHESQTAYGGFGAMPALSANLAAFTTGTKQSIGVDPAVWMAGLPNATAENDSWIPAFVAVQGLWSAALAKIAAGASAATVMPQLQANAQAEIDAWFKSNKLPH